VRKRERRLLGALADELRGKKRGECGGRGMVEEECGRKPEPCGGGESIAELDGHEGIESDLLERPMGLEGAGREGEDGGNV
jgi:hypothetical protein